MEDLIDPTLVSISNNVREVGLNLLNNAKNSMIDNFCSIKWLFHKLDEIKETMGQLEGQTNKSAHGILIE